MPHASPQRCPPNRGKANSYFRTHPTELATLIRNSDFYLSRAEVFDYHKLHSPRFNFLQQKFGLVSKMTQWYGKVSAIVHGQKPGGWTYHSALEKTSHVNIVLTDVVATFCEGEEIIHHFFLCAVAQELWDGFSTPSKRILLHGLSGQIKTDLNLDAA